MFIVSKIEITLRGNYGFTAARSIVDAGPGRCARLQRFLGMHIRRALFVGEILLPGTVL